MTIRLSASSFAGTARTLVAVGTVSDRFMFLTTAAAAPRSGLCDPAATGVPGFAAAGLSAAGLAGAAWGAAGWAGADGAGAGWAGAGLAGADWAGADWAGAGGAGADRAAAGVAAAGCVAAEPLPEAVDCFRSAAPTGLPGR